MKHHGGEKQLAKAYEPGEVEDRIYQFWLDGGYFHAEANPEKSPTPSLSRLPTSRGSCTWATPWTRRCRTS